MLTVHPPQSAGGATPHPLAVWIDLVSPDEAEQELVRETTGLDLPSRETLASLEQSARLVFDRDCLQLAAPVIADADTDHPSLSQVGLIVTPKRVVSIRFARLKMFETLGAKCGQAPPTSGAEVFVGMMEAYVSTQADLLEEARARLDDISHRVFRPSSASPRRPIQTSATMRDKLQFLGRMGERISLIRETLLGFERLIGFCLEQAKSWFSPEMASRPGTARTDIEELDQFESTCWERFSSYSTRCWASSTSSRTTSSRC